MLIRMCHEKKKKRKISVTINNKRQTLRDDHPTGFFYHNHHHHPKKTIISSPHLRSLQLFDRRKKHGIGHHLMWWWRRRRTTQRACTLATDLKASNHIDLLPPWLAWCTPRGARTRTIPSHTFTHIHTHNRPSVECFKPCAWQKALLLLPPLPPSLPPVYPPSILFSSKFKFCFYSKKNYAHQTHCLCAKNPHRFFSNTPSRLCPVEMVLRSTMQYILYKTDFYIIVLD